MKPLLIAILIILAFPKPTHVIDVGGVPDTLPRPKTALKAPDLSPQATLATIYVAPPQPVVGNCGSDYYQQLVYQRESGCNTAAVNYLGCAGIGQACPGSKLPCSLYDWVCQNNYFTSYMYAVYGSWAAAWNSELTRGWW